MLTEHAGFPFNDEVLDQERVLHAMIESFWGDEAPLISLIQDLIR